MTMTLAAGELVVPDWAWGFALGVLFTGWVMIHSRLRGLEAKVDRLNEYVRDFGPNDDDPGDVSGEPTGPGGPAC